MSGATDRRCFVCGIYVGAFSDVEWRDHEHACHDCQMALDDAMRDAVASVDRIFKATRNSFGKDAVNA